MHPYTVKGAGCSFVRCVLFYSVRFFSTSSYIMSTSAQMSLARIFRPSYITAPNKASTSEHSRVDRRLRDELFSLDCQYGKDVGGSLVPCQRYVYSCGRSIQLTLALIVNVVGFGLSMVSHS